MVQEPLGAPFIPKLWEVPVELGPVQPFFKPNLIDGQKEKQNLGYDEHFQFIKSNLLFNKSQLDWVHIIVGAEGTGKSNCAIRDCAWIDDKFLKQTKDLPQVIYTKRDFDRFIELLKTDSKYEGRRGISVLLDEAHTMFYSLDALKRENRDNKKFMMKARGQYSLFYCMNIQYIKDFDTYIRNQRARSLGKCYWKIDQGGMIKQGFVDYYSHKKLLQIKMNLQTRRPEFPMRSFGTSFPKADPKIWDLITEKKLDWLRMEGDYEYLKKEKKSNYDEFKMKMAEQFLLKIMNDGGRPPAVAPVA